MRRSLYWKLALAFMLVAIATAGSVSLFIHLTSADRLSQLILDQQRSNIQQALANYYVANGSWEGVAQNWRQIQVELVPTSSAPQQQGNRPQGSSPPDRQDRRGLFGLADANGLVLVSIDPTYPVGSQLPVYLINTGAAIVVDNKTVGMVLTAPKMPELNPQETLFLERTNQALGMAVVVGLLAALIMGILLARTLTNPLQALTRAAQAIARGQLEQQVNVKSQDEIGQLADAFNRMSQEVAQANRLRRQMTADIAHDLRTPLTVIGGYVEAMRDGDLAPTEERLSLIYAEIERLQHMVGDLRMLSQVDAGELPLNVQEISPRSLLERSAALFEHHAGQHQVRLEVEASEDLPEIKVDEARMMQVLDNLLSNALRYTPAGGKIRLAARREANKVRISVQDTGSGIPGEELPFIFNRFYRADKSRHSETGESGLGLAIVKALVEAQAGRVWAESQENEGTTIFVELPVRQP